MDMEGADGMKAVLRMLTMPISMMISVFIWICALMIRITGRILGLVSGLLLLLGLIVLTYSTQDALILFAFALLVSPIGLPMIAVGLLSVLNSIKRFLLFS